MPLYEYQCEACEGRFERIQKYSDPPIETCPSCGGSVRKLFSSPAIQFKGSGWYITDYARKSKGSGDSDGKTGTAKDKDKDRDKGKDKESTPAAAGDSNASTTSSSPAPAPAKKDPA